MEHSYLKHIIAAFVLALLFAFTPSAIAQVNINAPTGLNPAAHNEPEKKAETPATTTETKTEGTSEAGTTSTQSSSPKPSSGGASASRPRPAQQSWNNSAVSPARNESKAWMDNKKPESLNSDFSTGKNSSNLQSRQEVEMRSYGYRILVYQTNKSKNAKANAQKRAREIAVKFPQYQFYFNYKAPTWRLRLGDFANEEGAHRALKQMRQAFPMYAKEMTIIHDHINVWK